jgi:chemotaxis protein methyltransferase CheR
MTDSQPSKSLQRPVLLSPGQQSADHRPKLVQPATARLTNNHTPSMGHSPVISRPSTTLHNELMNDEINRIKAGIQANPPRSTPPATAPIALSSVFCKPLDFPPMGGPATSQAGYVSNNQGGANTPLGSRPAPKPMTSNELQLLSELVEDLCGIHIDSTKQYLLETRLLKMLIELGCQSYTEFVQLARGPKREELRPKLVDAMTTKETMWFRDVHPYETFGQLILPDVFKQAGNKPVKIWSAACSTGQEPYSIAMCLHEYAKTNQRMDLVNNLGNIEILGTDIATSSIMLSKAGRYDQLAMARGLSPQRREAFFTDQGRVSTINDEIKRLCDFKLANLQHDLPRLLGNDFDIIFMRNVAIYFTKDFKQELYAKLAKMLKPNGYLIIGATESMVGLQTPFKLQSLGKSTVYRL